MRKIELHKEGKSSLKERLLKTGTFKHLTGFQINLFPFKTNIDGKTFKADFISFEGIMGEVVRIAQQKELHKPKEKESYPTILKNTVIQNALQKVDTKAKLQLEDILTNIYFDLDHGLFKYDFHVISHMNFISNKTAIKDIPVFISDVFINGNDRFKQLLVNNESNNILNQLISECLPKQHERKDSASDKQAFKNMLPAVMHVFQQDFKFLMDNKEYFLANFEMFFKYYCFFYFTQLTLKLDDFGKEDYTIRPISFSMAWENLSESRLSLHKLGWKEISKHYAHAFAHANTLELLNYIRYEDEMIGDYDEITTRYNALQENEKDVFKSRLAELVDFYKENVGKLSAPANWATCEDNLKVSLAHKNFDQEITKLIYSFWYIVRYQFENGTRKKPYDNYASWLSSFAKENFTKSGGRLGSKFVVSQELLLFLTKLCVGDNEKIRLKEYWLKLRERGLTFDDNSKSEIVKLFERINLIEKKSDSGDAQYIKSSL